MSLCSHFKGASLDLAHLVYNICIFQAKLYCMRVIHTKIKLSYRCCFVPTSHMSFDEFQLHSDHQHHWMLAERKLNGIITKQRDSISDKTGQM